MSKLAKFRALTRPERQILFLAQLLLPITALGLRLFGLRRAQTALGKLGTKGMTADAGDALRAQRTARIVSAAARNGPYRASCLPTSLVLRQLLLRQGIESDLRLGVSKSGAAFKAHAWVEIRGLPLAEGQDVLQRFAAFDQAIPPAATAPK